MTLRSPIEDFLTGELTSEMRSELLFEIRELKTNTRYFEYNIYNVRLDGETSTVIIEDELDINRESVLTLLEFESMLKGFKFSS